MKKLKNHFLAAKIAEELEKIGDHDLKLKLLDEGIRQLKDKTFFDSAERHMLSKKLGRLIQKAP